MNEDDREAVFNREGQPSAFSQTAFGPIRGSLVGLHARGLQLFLVPVLVGLAAHRQLLSQSRLTPTLSDLRFTRFPASSHGTKRMSAP